MASMLMFRCTCGECYSVYIPKAVSYDLIGLSRADGEAEDRKEEGSGEIATSFMLTEKIGVRLLDSREGELKCVACGRHLDPIEMLKEKMREHINP